MNDTLKRIRDYQKKGNARREAGVFIVEGIKMTGEMPGDRLLTLVLSRSFLSDHPEESDRLTALASGNGAAVLRVSDDDFLRISDTQSPQGVLAVLKAYTRSVDEVLSKREGLYMLLENLQDPGNLGTILRAGEAAGVDGVIISAGSADPYNPKVIRSTMGSFFRVPFAVTQDLSGVVDRIQTLGGRVYAAHLKDSVPYDEPDYRGLTAFLIGNESKGLTDEITDRASSCVKIPMEGKVESLNAAMAATILMFEAKRQRNGRRAELI